MKQNKKIILLAGPTASGKSKLALKIAEHFKSEIINADSMQVYKEISILTSKPNQEDLKKIKHNLYGVISVKKKFSTGQWLNKVKKKIIDQWKNDKTPIIVGGTGLYFKALIDGLVKIPNISSSSREKISKLQKKLGQKKFFQKLIELDPLVKNFILQTDIQRSMRAYEVKKFTGKSLFEFIKETKSDFKDENFKKIFIDFPRDLLNKNIEKRVDKMFAEGAIEEVKRFNKLKIYYGLSANKIIGIREINEHLKGKLTLIETKELIQLKTRQYAKRQFTWARGHMKSWNMIYSSKINDLYKKAINKIS